MKQLFFFFSLLLSFITLSAQNDCPPADDYSYYDYSEDDSPPVVQPKMYLGGNEYSRNMNGLGALMTDLEYSNPNLHAYLQPEYQRLYGRQGFASAAMIIGGLGGGIMMVAGLGTSDDPYYPPPGSCGCSSEPQYNLTVENTGLVAAGTALFLTGTLIYVASKFSSHDLIRFGKILNENSLDSSLEFSFRPVINLGPLSSVGLSLLLEF